MPDVTAGRDSRATPTGREATAETAEAALGLSLRVGDVAVSISSDPDGPALRVRGPVGRFLTRGTPPEVSVRVRASWADLQAWSPPAGARSLFDAGQLWQLHGAAGRLVFSFRSPRFGPAPYKVATFDAGLTRGDVWLDAARLGRSAPLYPLEYPLDELLLIHLLALGRGAEVHACGLIDGDGTGHLFLGQSGAGKSTTARLWAADPHVLILSDDRIILRRTGDGVWMYGTPWHGDEPHAAPVHARLSHIHFLRQAPAFGWRPVSRTTAVAALVACSFLPFHDPHGLAFTLRFYEQVTRDVACHDLDFLPDGRMVDFIRAQRR